MFKNKDFISCNGIHGRRHSPVDSIATSRHCLDNFVSGSRSSVTLTELAHRPLLRIRTNRHDVPEPTSMPAALGYATSMSALIPDQPFHVSTRNVAALVWVRVPNSLGIVHVNDPRTFFEQIEPPDGDTYFF
jgi:hypothetical protein